MFEVINRQLGLNVSKEGSNKLIAAHTWSFIYVYIYMRETVESTSDKICINFFSTRIEIININILF